jgi:hypothetical protein
MYVASRSSVDVGEDSLLMWACEMEDAPSGIVGGWESLDE